MPFSDQEKKALLAVKGVGQKVIERLEEIGIESFEELKKYQSSEIIEMVASMLRTTCWKNSPQAKAAINAAIDRASKGL